MMKTMSKIEEIPKTTRWDPADYMTSRDDMAAYLEAALEDGEVSVIAAVLGDIARSRGTNG